LEAAIKKLDEQGETHKKEMTEKRAIDNQQKAMKMEELTNLLQDKPENAEKNADEIRKQAIIRITQTNERYIEKIKALKNANESEKEQIKKELVDVKAQIKSQKDMYEKNQKDIYEKSKNDPT
jgi:hypothetical protein